jgi:plasmid maintenance system antidote protein VapI
MNSHTQKQIGEIVGLKPNFFSDIIRERQKCPAVYALRLAPLTEIPLEIWIDPEPKGKRLRAWKAFMKAQRQNKQPSKKGEKE